MSNISHSTKVYSRVELEKLHTKQLLDRQRRFYQFWDKTGKFCVTRMDREYDDYLIYKGTEEDAKQERAWIKEILSTREHVPNKQESKQIRIQRAKQGVKQSPKRNK